MGSLSLAEKRILLILVTTDGDVQNRILHTRTGLFGDRTDDRRPLPQPNFGGMDFEQIRLGLTAEIEQLRSDIKPLMTAALAAGATPWRKALPLRHFGERTSSTWKSCRRT